MSDAGGGPNAFAGHRCRGGDRRGSRGAGSFASLGAAARSLLLTQQKKYGSRSCSLRPRRQKAELAYGVPVAVQNMFARAWQRTPLVYSGLLARSSFGFPRFALCPCPDLPPFSEPFITGDSRLLTRPGKLSQSPLEIFACDPTRNMPNVHSLSCSGFRE